MKSIQEKAKEYVDDYYQKLGVSKDEYPIDVEISKADFEAGANYVLDEIESLIKNVSDEYPRFQQGAIIYGRLIKLLEQLKR